MFDHFKLMTIQKVSYHNFIISLLTIRTRSYVVTQYNSTVFDVIYNNLSFIYLPTYVDLT